MAGSAEALSAVGRAVLGLWCVPGVGPRAIEKVREARPLEEIVDQPVVRWLSAVALPDLAREALLTLDSLGAHADRIFERARGLDQKLVFAGEDAYPRGLAGIRGAPPLLFFQGRGDRPNAPRRLATVGSRSFEGGMVRTLQLLACELAQQLILVSGGARGVDELCHRAALEVHGETWQFAGSSLDQLDGSTRTLAAAVLAGGGTVFSELPPGVRANENTFARRNRLISGASDAVLVLRAAERSGALITAEKAQEQGRKLLALPGQISDHTAKGTNFLIRHRLATLVASAADVFAELGFEAVAPLAREQPAVDLATLSSAAQEAFAVLDRQAIDFDQVLERATGLDSGRLASALMELELAGFLVQTPGRRYERR